MAGVSLPSGSRGGRKSVDANVNMVPMIDLLISVIAFLLMTAVWVHTGALHSRQPAGGHSEATPPPEAPAIRVVINPNGFHIGLSEASARDIAHSPRRFDELREAVRTQRRAEPAVHDVIVQPDSAVAYDEIAQVMDAIYAEFGAGRPAGGALRDTVRVQLM